MPNRMKTPSRFIGLGWLLLASLVTMAFIPSVAQSVLSPVFSFYDSRFPVVEMSGSISGRSENSIVLHIRGKKNRECRYLQLQALALHDGALIDVNIMRIDVPETGATKPKGVFDIGYWRVWPVDGASAVVVYVQHACNGRMVVTKIAEVAL